MWKRQLQRRAHAPSQGRRPRVLAVASGGGHWVQLMRLRPALRDCDVAYVTVNERYREEVGDSRFYTVNDATRWDKLGLVRLFARLWWIALRERPHVIISTGAAPGALMLLIGRVLGARTVWVDSMANVETLSTCGKHVRRFANLWMTQWPHLARPEGPIYEGSVL
jgi:UDP-N-acetylglucosamine:LPS N-acetylglucosamine transferase